MLTRSSRRFASFSASSSVNTFEHGQLAEIPNQLADVLGGGPADLRERQTPCSRGLIAGHSCCHFPLRSSLRICSVRSQFERKGSATLIMVSTSSTDFTVLLRWANVVTAA